MHLIFLIDFMIIYLILIFVRVPMAWWAYFGAGSAASWSHYGADNH